MGQVRSGEELVDLAGVEVLVGPADAAVADVGDEAHVHPALEAVLVGDLDPVLLDEAPLEHPDPAVAVADLRWVSMPASEHGEVVARAW